METAPADATEPDSRDASPIAPPLTGPAIGGSSNSDRSLAGNVSQCSLDRKRRKSEDGEDGDGCKQCSCRKSQCMKLYCVCFASGGYCSESCLCRQCLNQPRYSQAVQSTKRDFLPSIKITPPSVPKLVIKSSNPYHEIKVQEIGDNPSGSASVYKKGCRCKKSGCGKKYCDCYQTGVGCVVNCKCDDCRNPFGQKETRKIPPYMLQKRRNMLNPSEEETDEDTEDELETEKDDEYMATNAVISPPVRSPISRESSFQQLSSDDPDPPVINRHPTNFFPKPISQLPFLEYKPNSHNKIIGNNNFGSVNGNAYSIARCVGVMNGMDELSVLEKSIAPDLFLDSGSREIFLSLTPDVRLVWLRRKMKLLPR